MAKLYNITKRKELKRILDEIARGEEDLEALAPSLTLKEREYLIRMLEGQLKRFEKKLQKVVPKKKNPKKGSEEVVDLETYNNGFL